VRTDQRLKHAFERIATMVRDVNGYCEQYALTPDLLELASVATVGSLIVRCAMRRKESRGLHFNTDHPVRDDVNYSRDTVISRTI